jgi:hypothetical protein
MSKGPGRVQRTIIALIEAEPDGAWTVEDLCRAAYPQTETVAKTRRQAVLRAWRTMPATRSLPGTWTFALRLARPQPLAPRRLQS